MILWQEFHRYVFLLTLKLLLTGRRKRQDMDEILDKLSPLIMEMRKEIYLQIIWKTDFFSFTLMFQNLYKEGKWKKQILPI